MLSLLSLAAISFQLQAQAPITITGNGYTYQGTDSVASATSLRGTEQFGQPDTNASWDLGLIMINPGGYQTRLAPPVSNNPYADASYYFKGALIINPMLGFTCDQYEHCDSTGFYRLGLNTTQGNIQSLTHYTRNYGDSIYFPVQADTLSQPIQEMKFPASMDTSWTTTGSRQRVQFLVTASYFNLLNAPGVWNIERDVAYKVVGWGQMRVPLAQVGKSIYMPVLQVHVKWTEVDSYSINGGEPPAGFLTALSLTQGAKHQYYRTDFLRPGQMIPLAQAFHTDSTYTTCSSFFIQQNEIMPNAVSNLSLANSWKLFPNPVSSRQLHLSMPGNTSHNWQYRLINMAGQMVAQGNLSFNASNQSSDIYLSEKPVPGFYALQLSSEDGMRSIPVLVE